MLHLAVASRAMRLPHLAITEPNRPALEDTMNATTTRSPHHCTKLQRRNNLDLFTTQDTHQTPLIHNQQPRHIHISVGPLDKGPPQRQQEPVQPGRRFRSGFTSHFGRYAHSAAARLLSANAFALPSPRGGDAPTQESVSYFGTSRRSRTVAWAGPRLSPRPQAQPETPDNRCVCADLRTLPRI